MLATLSCADDDLRPFPLPSPPHKPPRLPNCSSSTLANACAVGGADAVLVRGIVHERESSQGGWARATRDERTRMSEVAGRWQGTHLEQVPHGDSSASRWYPTTPASAVARTSIWIRRALYPGALKAPPVSGSAAAQRVSVGDNRDRAMATSINNAPSDAMVMS